MTRGVCISGKQGSGKTTVARALQSALDLRGERAEVLSFAGPLKETARECLDALRDESLLCDDTDWGEMFTTGKWKYLTRSMLQVLGGTLRRYDEDVWVKLLLARAATLPEDTIILVDDLRYRNEARLLRKHGFMLVRLEASEDVRRARGVKIGGAEHASETDLDDWGTWDQVTHFTGSGDDLGPEQVAQTVLEALDARGDEGVLGWV